MNFSITHRVTGKTVSVISLIALLIFLPLLLLATYQTATIISRATGTHASIVVDARQETHERIDPGFMHAFAQGGEEAGDWLTPVQKEVAALAPTRIRIDHIYDFYDIVKQKNGRLEFDFSRLDEILDAIRRVGAVPVVSLSYMPPAIAKDGIITNPPAKWDDWTHVVQKTIEHVSGVAEKNIADVYYEVWNEPDHEQFGGWKLNGDKNYLTLYQFAAIGAAQASETRPFLIGGPATTGLYKNWIMRLVDSGFRLDFLSWHTYADEPNRFAADQKNITSWLLSYPNIVLIPKLITEFGFTGAKDVRYASPFAAAYTAAVFRQLASPGPKGLFSFQIKDGPGSTDGDGWGLIGHQSLGASPKPRAYVFPLLDRMAGSRLSVSGEGTWVTSLAVKQGASIRILLVNFDPYGSHTETVPVEIIGLPNGSYAYSQQYLQGMKPEERKTQQETVADEKLKKLIHMPTQSVALIELTPSSPH